MSCFLINQNSQIGADRQDIKQQVLVALEYSMLHCTLTVFQKAIVHVQATGPRAKDSVRVCIQLALEENTFMGSCVISCCLLPLRDLCCCYYV